MVNNVVIFCKSGKVIIQPLVFFSALKSHLFLHHGFAQITVHQYRLEACLSQHFPKIDSHVALAFVGNAADNQDRPDLFAAELDIHTQTIQRFLGSIGQLRDIQFDRFHLQAAPPSFCLLSDPPLCFDDLWLFELLYFMDRRLALFQNRLCFDECLCEFCSKAPT